MNSTSQIAGMETELTNYLDYVIANITRCKNLVQWPQCFLDKITGVVMDYTYYAELVLLPGNCQARLTQLKKMERSFREAKTPILIKFFPAHKMEVFRTGNFGVDVGDDVLANSLTPADFGVTQQSVKRRPSDSQSPPPKKQKRTAVTTTSSIESNPEQFVKDVAKQRFGVPLGQARPYSGYRHNGAFMDNEMRLRSIPNLYISYKGVEYEQQPDNFEHFTNVLGLPKKDFTYSVISEKVNYVPETDFEKSVMTHFETLYFTKNRPLGIIPFDIVKREVDYVSALFRYASNAPRSNKSYRRLIPWIY